jgi:hypothetical protein
LFRYWARGLKTASPAADSVSPGIHILHQPFQANASHMVRKNDLQVAHGRLFEIVATGIAVKHIPAVRRNANDVTDFVQQRVHRGIGPHEYLLRDDAGLRCAPETTGDRGTGC